MIAPAIHYPGSCAQAIALYEKAFKATDIDIAYYRDAPEDPGFPVPEDVKDLVMHAEMTICGSKVNLSDMKEPAIDGNRILLNAYFDSADDVRYAFNQLSEGGKVHVELGPQFFSAMYSSVEDRFGVRWQLIL